MLTKTLATLLFLTSFPLLAVTPPTECGLYKVNGIVREKSNKLALVVYEKTLSEHVITASPLEAMKLSPYLDAPVSANVTLTKKTVGYQFEAAKIEEAQSRISDPMNPRDESVVLVKKINCEKV